MRSESFNRVLKNISDDVKTSVDNWARVVTSMEDLFQKNGISKEEFSLETNLPFPPEFPNVSKEYISKAGDFFGCNI